MEKICFYSFVSDEYYYSVGTPILINSFKRFHPEIDLIIFRQDMVDKIFREKALNFYNAKPTFAKLLTAYYDLIVNIDADTVVTGRLDAVLANDYEVGAAWNYNDYENMKIKNVSEKMFVNAGLVASRNKKFWDIWEEANKQALKYVCKENDVLNLIWYNNPEVKKMERKIFDKEKDYYGCKSLNREKEFYMENDKLMCRKEQVFAYHHAKGGCLPKLQFEKMGFVPEVVQYLSVVSHYGKSQRYASI